MAFIERSVTPVGLTTVHSRLIVGINITSLVFATIAVILRVWARHLRRATLTAEDYLILLALV